MAVIRCSDLMPSHELGKNWARTVKGLDQINLGEYGGYAISSSTWAPWHQPLTLLPQQYMVLCSELPTSWDVQTQPDPVAIQLGLASPDDGLSTWKEPQPQAFKKFFGLVRGGAKRIYVIPDVRIDAVVAYAEENEYLVGFGGKKLESWLYRAAVYCYVAFNAYKSDAIRAKLSNWLVKRDIPKYADKIIVDAPPKPEPPKPPKMKGEVIKTPRRRIIKLDDS